MMRALALYLGNIWWALDVLLNVLAKGKRETVSSRCGWQIIERRPCWFCAWFCGLLDKTRWKDHCINNRMESMK
ncbi:hypothetical protein SAMN06265795_12259 [Noviherbaspirillum humi]|uniref:Uncharacterized protein n=1 Tax=Noviherbaspirillum humi TaxID=1688639 RepID=A0A239LF00_9BURK|nr:hypothetical protein [Noviherbaspirillum humi]SNT29216.1 hypothetical protein SAMN06265795_12259 [Noviherbaspirillum humi]